MMIIIIISVERENVCAGIITQNTQHIRTWWAQLGGLHNTRYAKKRFINILCDDILFSLISMYKGSLFLNRF